MRHCRKLMALTLSALSFAVAMPAAAEEPELMPWTVSVAPRGPAPAYLRPVALMLQRHLQQAGFEVVEAPAAVDLATEAAGANAHVFRIKFEGHWTPEGDGGRFALALEASHPTTARLLASASEMGRAVGPGARDKAMEAAANAAAPELIKMLRAEQRREAERGREMMITFREPPAGAEVQIGKLLRTVCDEVRKRSANPRQLQYTARCRADESQVASTIREGLKKAFPHTEIEKVAQMRYSLTLAFPSTPARRK